MAYIRSMSKLMVSLFPMLQWILQSETTMDKIFRIY